MSPRDKRLEQGKPKGNTPVKAWKRKRSAPNEYRKGKGGFSKEDLPSGTIRQNRAKPGMTTPQ